MKTAKSFVKSSRKSAETGNPRLEDKELTLRLMQATTLATRKLITSIEKHPSALELTILLKPNTFPGFKTASGHATWTVFRNSFEKAKDMDFVHNFASSIPVLHNRKVKGHVFYSLGLLQGKTSLDLRFFLSDDDPKTKELLFELGTSRRLDGEGLTKTILATPDFSGDEGSLPMAMVPVNGILRLTVSPRKFPSMDQPKGYSRSDPDS